MYLTMPANNTARKKQEKIYYLMSVCDGVLCWYSSAGALLLFETILEKTKQGKFSRLSWQ